MSTTLLVLILPSTAAWLEGAQQQDPPASIPAAPAETPDTAWQAMIYEGLTRLPLAGVLGAALAFRFKRRGTPERTPAVVQTQIILAMVGALIMLVVGSSLARAFGIVGAANLIRYRSKIDDPKDAGVMLCCLAVGLASGVGLYALATFATVFLVAALALIESFETNNTTHFELQLTGIKAVAEVRPRLEETLTRELREELRLELGAGAFRYFTRFDFDLSFAGLERIWRYFYEVALKRPQLDDLHLQEGSEMRLFSADELLLNAVPLTPYDAFALWFHINQGRLRA